MTETVYRLPVDVMVEPEAEQDFEFTLEVRRRADGMPLVDIVPHGPSRQHDPRAVHLVVDNGNLIFTGIGQEYQHGPIPFEKMITPGAARIYRDAISKALKAEAS